MLELAMEALVSFKNEIDSDVHERKCRFSFMQTTLIKYVVSAYYSAWPLGNRKKATLLVLKVPARRKDKYMKRMVRCQKKSVQEGTILSSLAQQIFSQIMSMI